ncbi:tRNA (guanosine(46)-N7)-methyltransferase TrmB [Actinomyces sp. oral taxon 181]|uniref:tRNA (guanosine(46)-N7)-methyltransferase TrmB n=1 Tax=Actinomyces sp. oral taxon 181 TaxID=712121 RepID=UPI0002A3D8D7|nr:tRNA (guanine-N(7)-)-methyltransferase [Actinomyces sp. oral taxon 181 str. F0379]
MIVAEDNESAGGAAAQAADIAQSAGVNTRNGRRPGDAPEGTVFMSRTKSFTRRSRELPPNLARTWDAHAERYVIEPRRGIGYTTVAEDFRLDPVELFGRSAPLTLEIGSGTGEQIVAAAAAHPDRDYLALEVWVPGIAKLVSKAVEAGVDNIRVLEADVAQALPIVLGDACLDEVWTFFPDPWRKARHRKRRLVSDAFALQVARVLRDGGVWRLATDWDDYAWQMRDVIEACPLFENPYVGQRPDPEDPEPQRGGFAPRYEGRVVTHFETRGIDAGRRAHDIVGVRVPRQ